MDSAAERDASRTATEARRDRARGALVGLAAGDAVGTTVEFAPPGSFEPLTDMVGGGPFNLAAGAWTDDTSMALCLAESIIDTDRSKDLDLVDHLRRYLAWREHGRLSSTGTCFDIGNTTNQQLSRFARTGEAVDPDVDEDAAANGSLMRLAPIPISAWFDIERAARLSGESSRSTHPATRPVDACRLLGAMIAALIAGTDAEEVFSPTFWNWGQLHPQVAEVAAGSYRHKQPPEIRGSGYCIDALEAAIWAVAGAVDVRDAVLRAANLGDDADTTAAIAGQLAGARWGYEAISSTWRTSLVSHDRVVSLADALFDRGTPMPASSRPWAFDAVQHAWWAKPGLVLAGEYPNRPSGESVVDSERTSDPNRHDKLELLLDAGIRTFVDLTSPDDGLSSYSDALGELARYRGLDLRHRSFPIPDMGVIPLDGYREIIDAINAEISDGRPVFVHCWGGVGRTGTVIGCLLGARDSGDAGAQDAIARIAALRNGTRKSARRAPDTDEQIEVVHRWCRSCTA